MSNECVALISAIETPSFLWQLHLGNTDKLTSVSTPGILNAERVLESTHYRPF